MKIAEMMSEAEQAAKVWTRRLGSAVVEDIGQDAVMACWEASKTGEPFDVPGMVNQLANREWKHARPDQGPVTVPLDEVAEWMPSINVSAGSEPGMDFGVSRMPVPGVASVTRAEMALQAAEDAEFEHPGIIDALWSWVEHKNSTAGRRGGKSHNPPANLTDPIRAELPGVLTWWGHRNRTRCAADWDATHAMSPTTAPVPSPAELSDAEVRYFAREGTPRLKPTPIKDPGHDAAIDLLVMLELGPGKVNAPSRRGKREGQATVALGGRNRWADVGSRH